MAKTTHMVCGGQTHQAIDMFVSTCMCVFHNNWVEQKNEKLHGVSNIDSQAQTIFLSAAHTRTQIPIHMQSHTNNEREQLFTLNTQRGGNRGKESERELELGLKQTGIVGDRTR